MAEPDAEAEPEVDVVSMAGDLGNARRKSRSIHIIQK